MRELTHEWVAKAEGDYHTTLRESRARTYPNYHPGENAIYADAQVALRHLKSVRAFVRSKLNLPEASSPT
jgi:hypothetical protein